MDHKGLIEKIVEDESLRDIRTDILKVVSMAFIGNTRINPSTSRRKRNEEEIMHAVATIRTQLQKKVGNEYTLPTTDTLFYEEVIRPVANMVTIKNA